MSNSLAIAAVTSTLRFVLDRSLASPHPGPVGGATVTTLRPGDLDDADLAGTAGVNLFCYAATPNHAWNLTDLPTRRGDGSLVQRPVAALDLHFLITCHGDDAALEPQRLLGRVVAALATTSVLTRDAVTAALDLYGGQTETSFLTASDLADEVELVKLSPATLTLEEMSKLWSVLDTPYLLSLTYLATVVLVAADVTPRVALPVRQRSLTVAPHGPPFLASLDTDPPGSPAGVGTALVLRGSALTGPGTAVRVGGTPLAPDAGGTAAELRTTLDASVRAGVHAVQVVHRSPPGPDGSPPARLVGASNAVPLLVRPSVVVAAVDDTTVTLTVTPPLGAGQRVTVVLDRLDGGVAGEPDEVSLLLPAVAEDEAPMTAVTVPRAGIPDGTWLLRIQVDGVQSLPVAGEQGYDSPSLTLPPP